MISTRTSNQLHPPKKKNGDKVELNKKCTIIKKDGRTTSVVGTGTKNACKVFVNSLKTNAKNLNIVLEGNYVIINHEIK